MGAWETFAAAQGYRWGGHDQNPERGATGLHCGSAPPASESKTLSLTFGTPMGNTAALNMAVVDAAANGGYVPVGGLE